MPEDALVNMLKTLPGDVLIDVFRKAASGSDDSPQLARGEMFTGRRQK